MKFPFYKQKQKNDCALICFKMLYEYIYHKKIKYNLLKNKLNFTKTGINILELTNLGQKYNLILKTYKIIPKLFLKFTFDFPIMMQIKKAENYHFVVIYKLNRKGQMLVADPGTDGLMWLQNEILLSQFSGVLIIFKKTEDKYKTTPKLIISKSFLFLKKIKKILLNNYKKWHIFLNKKIIFLLLINLSAFCWYFFAELTYKGITTQLILKFDSETIYILSCCFITFNLLKIFFNFISETWKNDYKIYYSKLFYQKLRVKFYDLSVTNFYKNDEISFYSLFNSINNIIDFFNYNLITLISSIITFILISSLMIKINLYLWIITLLNGLSYSFIHFVLQRNNKKIFKLNQSNEQITNKNIINFYHNFEDISSRGCQSYFFERLTTQIKNQAYHKNKQKKLKDGASIIYQIILWLINALSLYWAMNMILGDRISLEDYFFLSTMSIYIYNFFENISELAENWWNTYYNFKNLEKYIMKTEVKTMLENFNVSEINLQKLNFFYNTKKVFSNLNMNINNHHILIGNSGIGKTSLLKIIGKIHENYTGSIMINNIDLKSIDYMFWRKKCLYLNLNSILHSGTIIENIVNFNLKNNHITDHIAFIKKTLKTVNLSLEEKCIENGSNFSAGQKQIILFLSIFAQKWEVLLLDEVLNNVSFDLQHTMIEYLKKHFTNQLIIFVSHNEKIQNLFNRKLQIL